MRIFLLIGVMTWHVVIFNVMADLEREEEKRKLVNALSTLFVTDITKRETGNFACSPLVGISSFVIKNFDPTDREPTKDGIDFLVKTFNRFQSPTFISGKRMFISKNCYTLAAFDEAAKDVSGFTDNMFKSDNSHTFNAARDILDSNSLIPRPDCPTMLDSKIGVVMVNDVWIEGKWLHKFNAKQTKSSTFHLNSQSDTEVPIMFQTNKFKFGEIPGVNANFLELPYKVKKGGNAASMVILRPNEIDGLADLENYLERIDFDEFLRAEPRKVEVGLPKFFIKSTLSYRKDYEKERLEDNLAFALRTSTDSNEFNGTFDAFHVKCVQKTHIAVDEYGTQEAVYGFWGGLSHRDLGSTENRFIVDRPFLAVVVKSGVNSIYARIMNPLEKTEKKTTLEDGQKR